MLLQALLGCIHLLAGYQKRIAQALLVREASIMKEQRLRRLC